jgi:hypothetical protein
MKMKKFQFDKINFLYFFIFPKYQYNWFWSLISHFFDKIPNNQERLKWMIILIKFYKYYSCEINKYNFLFSLKFNLKVKLMKYELI